MATEQIMNEAISKVVAETTESSYPGYCAEAQVERMYKTHQDPK